jgi:hypothetical protein
MRHHVSGASRRPFEHSGRSAPGRFTPPVCNAIYARSHNGIVYEGAVRDINGLKELDDLNSTMIGINIPIRIGMATVLPGDVALGREGGVLFIPPQVAEQVVQYSEITHLRDMFGHQRLQEKKYTAGQIDGAWPAPIEADFTEWFRDNIDKLPVARAQVEEILKGRSR